ncbi:CASP-like protein 4B3 [Hordeum vulgare]|nr:CASP-like protein 4B3 [Hordeum vulgare]
MSFSPASSEPHDAPASRSITERWKMEAAPIRARLLLRAFAWLFSLLALVVMATDVHGRGGAQDFSTYPEYKHVVETHPSIPVSSSAT